MKIAFLNIYNGIVDRGSEVFVKEMANILSSKNQVIVFQSGNKENEKYEVHQKKVPFIKNQGILYDLVVAWFTLLTLKSLWNEKPDWIIPVNGRIQVLLTRIFRFLHGGEILISGHAGIGFEDHWNITIGKPDVFIALSPKQLAWAKRYTKKAEYIPNGINLNEFTPVGPKKELPLKHPVIFTNSALLEYKRIELVIQAVELIPKASLLLIGDGPLRSQVTEEAKQKLGERFMYISRVSHADLATYYRASDIFTLPSKESEAFGLVYLEALATNLPVVAPIDQNRQVIIGNAGILCNVENKQEYANAISSALEKNWHNTPRTQAEKFSWGKIGNLYEQVLKRY